MPFGASLTFAPRLPSATTKGRLGTVRGVQKSVFYFCPEFCRTDISVGPKGEEEKNFAFTERAGRRYMLLHLLPAGTVPNSLK